MQESIYTPAGSFPAVRTEVRSHTYGDSTWRDRLTEFNGKDISYDAIGNPTTIGSTNLTWEGRSLVGYVDGANTYSYEYDMSGHRISKTVNGVKTIYYYDGDQLVAQQSGNDRITFMFDANGSAFGFYYNNAPYFFIKNIQGDVTALTDFAGRVIGTYVYDAWGNLIESASDLSNEVAAMNPIRYRGYYYDAETGYYFLNSRYYSAEMGRFITPEPNVYEKGFDAGAGLIGFNLYAYCANNPVLYIDSDGESVLLAMAIGAGVGALISGVMTIYQNYKTEQVWYNGLVISMVAGCIGGAISCFSIPGVSAWFCAAIFGATGNLISMVIMGEINSLSDLTCAIMEGAVAGLLGNAAAELLVCGVTKYFDTLTKAQQKAFLSKIGQITNAQLTSIRQQVKNGLTPEILKQLVEEYGYDVLVSAFVSSTSASF